MLTACGSSSDDDTGPAPGHAGKGAGAGAAGDDGTGGAGAEVGGASGRGGMGGGHAGVSSGSGGRAGSGAVAGSGGAAGMSGSGGVGGTAGSGVAGNDGFCQRWPQCATVRRPFLVGSDMRSAEPREREDWTRVMPPVAIAHARTAEFLAESWLKDALEEHASIRNAFEVASAHVLAMPVVDYGVDETVWHAHGRVTCAEARAVARQGLDESYGRACGLCSRQREPVLGGGFGGHAGVRRHRCAARD